MFTDSQPSLKTPPLRSTWHHGVEGLQRVATAWNDLWERSSGVAPTVLAESIEQWACAFAQPEALRVLTVSSGDQLVAGIPLVKARWGNTIPTLQLPVNCWSQNGDLLWDERSHEAVACLTSALRSAGILVLDDVPFTSRRFREFIRQLTSIGGCSYLSRRREIGLIDTLGDWNLYEGCWSKKFRNRIHRDLRRLRAEGDLQVERLETLDTEALQQAMETAFRIEDDSWKGQQGSSILRTPGMAEHFHQEAQFMHARGHLDVWFLTLDGEPIAFQYCHLAKGICFAHKIGFAAAYRKLAPGMVLQYLLLQAYHEDPRCRFLDTIGTFDEPKSRWCTRTYSVGRLVAATGALPKLAVRAYTQLHRQSQALRPDTIERFTPRAAAYLEQRKTQQSTPSAWETTEPLDQTCDAASLAR